MKTIKLNDLLARTEVRKRELGVIETTSATEALRNKGSSRTPEKRELLRRAELRARQANRKSVASHY